MHPEHVPQRACIRCGKYSPIPSEGEAMACSECGYVAERDRETIPPDA
jgi:ribosomal protein L37E